MSFFSKKKDKKTLLEMEVDRLIYTMSTIEDQTSQEYQNCLNSLEKLLNQKGKKEPVKVKEALNPNTIIFVLGSLAEIVAIVTYEEAGHIIRTKAFSRIFRPRL